MENEKVISEKINEINKVFASLREKTFTKIDKNGNTGNEWADCLSYNDDLIPVKEKIIKLFLETIMNEILDAQLEENKTHADLIEDLKAAQTRIAELEARLENAVELPLKAGEKGFVYGSYEEIDGTTHYYLNEVTFEGFLDERHRGGKLWYLVCDNGDSIDLSPEDLCLTKAEAEARLKELNSQPQPENQPTSSERGEGRTK